ncbi:hypothetical protein [Microbacterium enclense]
MSTPTASAVIAETYLINVESGENANKFYRATTSTASAAPSPMRWSRQVW